MSSQRHPALTSVALGVSAVAVTAALAVGAGTLVRAYVPDDEAEPTESSEPPEEPPRVVPLDASEVATVDASVAVAVSDDVPIAQNTPPPVMEHPRPPPRRRARVRTRAS
jgi:hypothetical protein